MAAQPIPFGNFLQSGDEELGGASPQANNVTIDGAGAVRRRPGIGSYFSAEQDIGTPVGLHVTETGAVFAVSQTNDYVQRIYRVTPGGVVNVGPRAAHLRPIFAETEMLLVIAHGQAMSKIELASPSAVTDLGGDPPQASHVVRNSSRLFANDLIVDRTAVRYSNPARGTVTYAGHENWTPSVVGGPGFFFADALPDPVVAQHTTTDEIWVFGSQTTQLFGHDSQAPGLKLAAMETGCAAPYSVIKREGQFYWLDHARRFVASSGRGVEVLSQGIHRTIQGLTRVDDCYGYRVLLGPLDCLAWTFPTDGRTFVLQEGGGWSEWSAYSYTSNQFIPFPVTAHAYDRTSASNLVGLPGIGVGVLERRPTDLSVSGDSVTAVTVKAEVTTGFLNRGTDARKRCKSVRLVFRRGSSARLPELRGLLMYRDSLGPWEAVPVVLDGMQPVVELTSLGVYRRRQWRYSFSDDVEDLVLAGAEEEFEVTE